jgi:AraC-like DNA-binding protein
MARKLIRAKAEVCKNASVVAQGCADFSSDSTDRNHSFTPDPRWASPSLRPGLSFRYTQDLGRDMSRAVARMLVVYCRRPGGQLQYSSLLELDPASDRIRRVLSFAPENLSDSLSVERLAEVAHLSTRQFGRAFVAATGMSPAKAIERLRVESARCMVEDTQETLEMIARAVGFADPERMRQSFIRVLGEPSSMLRRAMRANEFARGAGK